MRRRVWWLSLVTLLALVAGSAWWYLDARGQRADAERLLDRAATAREAAEDAVPRLLSYDHRTLDDDLLEAREEVTPHFLPDFQELQDQLIGPATRQQRLATTATVDRSALVSVGVDSVEVLVFVRQRTSAPQRRTTSSTSRAVVTMARSGDRWLVDDLEAL